MRNSAALPWGRLLPVGNILQDILHPAVQDFAQGIEGGSGNGFPVLHAVDGVGCYALLKDKIIFCYAFSVQRLIKGPVTDHFYHLQQAIILYILTIPYL